MQWEEVIPTVLYGYRRRTLREGHLPFELLYETMPRMHHADSVTMLRVSIPLLCRAEMLAALDPVLR